MNTNNTHEQCLVQGKLSVHLCYCYLILLDFGLDQAALAPGLQCFLSYLWALGTWGCGLMTGITHS